MALACLTLTGCMGYTLTPERPASMPKAALPPLPLKVGLVIEEGKDGGFGSKFAEALDGARLFSEVRRGAQTGVDLVIQSRFSSNFIQDPMQAPKIIFVVFTGFLTGAIMSETSHHTAQGALSVAYPRGETLKSYDGSVDVVAKSMVSAFAEQKTMKLGPPAALDNLVAKRVQVLIDDRPFFAGLGKAPPAPAAPVAVVEPSPQVEPAAVAAAVEPASEPEPKAAVKPEPAKRGPLTPAEESEIDEQLMP
jgi:hypothetical protein